MIGLHSLNNALQFSSRISFSVYYMSIFKVKEFQPGYKASSHYRWTLFSTLQQWLALPIIQSIPRIALLTFCPQVRAIATVIVRAIDTVSLIIKSLPCSAWAVWNTTAILIGHISALAVVAECPKLWAGLAVVIRAVHAVSVVISSLTTPTLFILVLDTLLSIAGPGISIVTLLACPFDDIVILIRRLGWCTAGDDVLVVYARNSPRVPGGGQEADQPQEEESAECVHGSFLSLCA